MADVQNKANETFVDGEKQAKIAALRDKKANGTIVPEEQKELDQLTNELNQEVNGKSSAEKNQNVDPNEDTEETDE